MPRISGVNIPNEKRIEIALTYVYGIGLYLSRKILKEAGIDFSVKAKDLTTEEIGKLKKVMEDNYKVEGDLRREIITSIKRLKNIASWRGHRHDVRLPVRGQRTKTNSRTVRGNKRRTVGSGKKQAQGPK